MMVTWLQQQRQNRSLLGRPQKQGPCGVLAASQTLALPFDPCLLLGCWMLLMLLVLEQ